MRKICFINLLFLVLYIGSGSAEAQTNEFTYQGKLTDAGMASVTYDFEFRLCAGNITCGPPFLLESIQRLNVPVTNGIFTVTLNFNAVYFNGNSRYLEIWVRRNSNENWTTLSPSQKITSAPYSIKSLNASSADSLSSACVSCVTDANIQALSGNKLTGVIAGDGSGLTNLNGANIAAGSVTPTQLSAETLPNSYNLKVLGTLRWDLVKSQRFYNIGIQPYGIAFDGVNIWVVDFNGTTVKKIRTSDGAVLGTFTVGNALRFIAFDGANMWITSTTPSAGVIKVRASDGAVLGTFPTPNAAFNLAFDGENMWVLNGSSVTKFRTSDGANLGTFPAGNSPSGIAFDGAYIWITHLGAAAGLKKINAADGTSVDYAMTTGGGIAFDGSYIWLANTTAGSLVKVRVFDGAILNSYPIASGANQVAFDGANLWVINNPAGSGVAAKVRAVDGVTLASFAIGSVPVSLAFDGANMWVTNSGSNNITRLVPAFQQ